MNIILKHTFKNIFKKPGRTFLLTLCIFMCALSGLICLDMVVSLERIFASTMGSVVGKADIQFNGDMPIEEDFLEGFPENNALFITAGMDVFFERDPQMYSYAIRKPINILGFDLKKAYDMRAIPAELELSENEVAFSEKLAEVFEVSEGDNFYFHNPDGEKEAYLIKRIIKNDGLLSSDPNSCVMSPEGLSRISYGHKVEYSSVLIDFINNNDINPALEMMKEKYPEADILNITDNKELQAAISQISSLFATMFAVCLLIVVIITITVSERIIGERMSVIGTLRSLGVSQSMTAFFLLLENIIYALMGSIPAILIYINMRDAIFSLFFTIDAGFTIDFGQLDVTTAIAVLLATLITECACTLKEIIKASRTAIRDIIFLNKDTEYRFSNKRTIIGIVCGVLSVLLYLCFKEVSVALIICFICFIVAVFLLFPYVTVKFSELMGKLFDKAGFTVAKLSAMQSGTKKSTIASSSLIVAATSITILVFIFADSSYKMFTTDIETADIIMPGYSEDYLYDYVDDLEGVVATENLYETFTYSQIKDSENKNTYVYGYDNWEMFNGITGISGEISNDECYLGEIIGEKYGIEVGDEIEIVLDSDSLIARTVKFTVAGFCNSIFYDNSGYCIVMSKDNFIMHYRDSPSVIFIRTDGTNDEEIIEKINKYSSSTAGRALSAQKYREETLESNKTETRVIKIVGLMGILLTFVGVVSNQLIGFEGRKREFAVLISTSMGKNVLARMLVLETVISSSIALLCSIPLGVIAMLPISRIMKLLELSMPFVADIPQYLMLVLILLGVFTLTTLWPISKLRKIKLAEQLKYE